MAQRYVMGECPLCHLKFTYDRDLAPHIRDNKALCEPCLDRANEFRAVRGLEPIEYDPSAYALDRAA